MKTILTKKQQKVSVLSSGKTDKYEYLTGEKILPSDESRTIDQAKFSYSPLVKFFKKQIKTTQGQGIKQGEALKVLKSEENQELEIIRERFIPAELRYKIIDDLRLI